MNEIERLKSIDVNGAVKKALVEQEKSKSLDEIERAIEFLGYVKGYDIQSANFAIEALREQAERSKGCVICPASGMEITDDDYCSYSERGK